MGEESKKMFSNEDLSKGICLRQENSCSHKRIRKTQLLEETQEERKRPAILFPTP